MSGSVEAARRAFPSGLFQPKGSYRFAADSLALAAFGQRFLPEKAARFVDLGCGCGVVGLALLLQSPDASGFGVEREGALVLAARQNADRLGFSERFGVFEADVAKLPACGDMPQGGLDLALANPPWRLRGACRLSPLPLRRAALAGDENTFPSFARAAFFLLKPGGRFACVVCPERERALHEAALNAGFLSLERRVPSSNGGRPAPFALLAFRKQG